jgi:hypothetical protein
MKRFASGLLIFLAAISATLGFAAYAYLQQPLFGNLLDNGRVSRIEQSPNYANGRFHNQIDTPLHTAGSSELSMWMELIFGKKGAPRPQGVIPSEKTDLTALVRQRSSPYGSGTTHISCNWLASEFSLIPCSAPMRRPMGGESAIGLDRHIHDES